MTDMTVHVRPARPARYHQARTRQCPECGTEPLAGHIRCIGCHDPRTTPQTHTGTRNIPAHTIPHENHDKPPKQQTDTTTAPSQKEAQP